MYHSIVFKNADGITKNTWDNWHLIPTAKPSFPVPEPRTNYVDIPGKDGSIDMTTYLTGDVSYSDRSAAFEFIALDTENDWESRCTDISNFLHGKTIQIILEDDPFYYYEGRAVLEEKKTDGQFPMIKIGCRVGPFKKHIGSNSESL